MSCLVKICGITNINDAMLAVRERADLLGFIFVDASPRSISVQNARTIIEGLPNTVKKVGVFQNEDLQTVKNVATELQLDYVQLHGQETPDYCKEIGFPVIKVLEIDDVQHSAGDFAALCESYKDVAEIILADRPKKYSKSGNDWLHSVVALLKTMPVKHLPLVMAGGLNRDNISFVIDELSPHGIDCASGVEASPGIKDQTKLKQFMTAIKGELVS